ncbi:MAG: response regulator transcription factor [Limosilactobacillus sp.]|uniref:response regulator transcription factor n=1 Tax=Limosilactobacillus sp. TaxID=2773925 RepID=UPI00270A5A81|nr:response regulator transcription factor [Limosilactobacillus sp.]
MVKIYLAEDQKMLNSALAMLLDLEDDFEVVGTSLDGQDALNGILRTRPDVAILDIEMPKMTGLEIADALNQKGIDIKIVILTTFSRKNYFKEAMENHVNAYLLKDSPSDSLVDSIRAVLNGEVVIDPKLISDAFSDNKSPLTEREIEILQALKSDPSTKDLAKKFFLSEGTIRNYISNILSKTGTKSRLEALNMAERNGWI